MCRPVGRLEEYVPALVNDDVAAGLDIADVDARDLTGSERAIVRHGGILPSVAADGDVTRRHRCDAVRHLAVRELINAIKPVPVP